MDITDIITDVKKSFTRDRASVIGDFLQVNPECVVLSYIKKARGDSIKFYYMKDNKKCASDYVVKNAKVLIQAFLKNGVQLHQYVDGKIEDYKEEKEEEQKQEKEQ